MRVATKICVCESARNGKGGGVSAQRTLPMEGIYNVNVDMVRSRVQEHFTCTNASGMDWSKPNRTVSHWA